MIKKETVKKLVEERLDDNMFIVEITVNEYNVINVFIDSFDGLTIDQCIAVSRHVEHSFDREEEDFELHVSSPGLTEKFKVSEQYYKYVGKSVEVKTLSGLNAEGIIVSASDDGIVFETSKREKVEGHKKKQLVVKQYQLKYEEIEIAKAVISFK
jgi:ribosome maturation factor RimP